MNVKENKGRYTDSFGDRKRKGETIYNNLKKKKLLKTIKEPFVG